MVSCLCVIKIAGNNKIVVLTIKDIRKEGAFFRNSLQMHRKYTKLYRA